ncbi:hypothetical protein [Facilibium subflavum]|uniref:hypothetical protein n=1 Tax=Facilibium subflavum TaxID=2219058 RepID=UPI000E64D9CC|nr:hypothetical protein [Facilibium subflavum]
MQYEHGAEAIPAVLKTLPENDRISAVLLGNRFNENVLSSLACQSDNSKVVIDILNNLPPKDRLVALQSSNILDTVLHQLCKEPQLLVAALKTLPEQDRGKALLTVSSLGTRVIDKLNRDTLPSEAVSFFATIKVPIEKDKNNNALLHSTGSFFNSGYNNNSNQLLDKSP